MQSWTLDGLHIHSRIGRLPRDLKASYITSQNVARDYAFAIVMELCLFDLIICALDFHTFGSYRLWLRKC